MPKDTLQGNVVIVTGAGSGLGEATARAFAAEGCKIACVDLKGDQVERVSKEIQGQGQQALSFACDVSNPQQVGNVVDSVVERFGRLDIVVNCAAIDHTVSVDEMSVEQWNQVIGVNLNGPFLFSKAALAPMKKQHSGHIVNVSSTAATRAWANASAYHASKWGLIGFSRGLSVEGRQHGVRVTTIIPGGMKTHFFDRFVDQGIPMPDQANLQEPANVADMIVYAVQVPKDSALQEVIITPFTETSWP